MVADMNLCYRLDEEATAQCEAALESPIEYCIPADLTLDGHFDEAYFVIGEKKWAVWKNGEIREAADIRDYKSYKLEPMVGNAYLGAENEDGARIIVRCTMRQIARMAYIAQILTQKSKELPIRIYNDEEDRICPKCGGVLVHGTRVCSQCMNKSAVVKRVALVAKKQVPIMIVGSLLLIVITILSLAMPKLQKLLINGCLDTQTPDYRLFAWLIVGMAACVVGSQLLSIVRRRYMASIGSRISADLREMVYNRIQELSLGFLTSQRAGALMNRITNDTNRIRTLIEDFGSSLLNQALLLLGVGLVLFVTDWRMALIVIIPAPLLTYFQRIMWKKVIHKLFHRLWVYDDRANSFLHDVLSGVRVVKSFGREDAEIEKFAGHCGKFRDMSVKSEQTWILLIPISSFFIQLSSFIIIYMGCYMIMGGTLTIGELIEFTSYTSMLYGPLSWIMNLPRRFADAAMSVDRIFTIIDEQPEIVDTEKSGVHTIEGNVKFKDVTFGYHSYEPILKNVHLDVKSGEMIGLVGHSGAGKSTLINLITRFYDVNEGSITIDGVDLREILQENLRSQIGVVLQETFLFTGTILDNIRYAKADATLEDVIAAAKTANAHDFIVSFPDGYDTWVNENGNNLSGGERQRLSIARAVLSDPKILILDEATASLDVDTESAIQEALGRLIQHRTTFAIAHRLSTLRNADRLLVLEKGEIAEIGTHEELLKAKGIYYGLVIAQRQMTKIKQEVPKM